MWLDALYKTKPNYCIQFNLFDCYLFLKTYMNYTMCFFVNLNYLFINIKYYSFKKIFIIFNGKILFYT